MLALHSPTLFATLFAALFPATFVALHDLRVLFASCHCVSPLGSNRKGSSLFWLEPLSFPMGGDGESR